jgi:predicted dithiol-disulfide oxidoreductase (DUF899 family)
LIVENSVLRGRSEEITSANGTEAKNQVRKHKVVSREEWVAAQKKFLKAEKELTRRSDEPARTRQELPWIKLDKEYRMTRGRRVGRKD